MDTQSRFCHEHGRILLRTEKLTKTYRVGGQLVHALQDVDFQADQGDFVVINGPSGSGKTTFLNLISAIDRPTSGDVLIDGEPVSTQSEGQLARLRKSRIGLVFQSFNLIPVLSAAENVEYPLLLQRIERAERKRRVLGLLEEVDIADLARRRPNELSGGQRQRVAIARALITRPKLVLADEPTANLDSETGKRVMELMRGLNQEHCVTFIVVTHDPAVSAYAQRHIRILDGRIDERSEHVVAASSA
ncbi:ABC transporter ATP-binding protein [Candidatus Bipolaricaulota bacterium]|nr:ABC transporter ATP-binding protein [Candidatus Bipolaricaulota bacterium]